MSKVYNIVISGNTFEVRSSDFVSDMKSHLHGIRWPYKQTFMKKQSIRTVSHRWTTSTSSRQRTDRTAWTMPSDAASHITLRCATVTLCSRSNHICMGYVNPMIRWQSNCSNDATNTKVMQITLVWLNKALGQYIRGEQHRHLRQRLWSAQRWLDRKSVV